MAELLLDERIMWWVFLPIVYVTFILTMARIYYSKYLGYKQQRKAISRAGYGEHVYKQLLEKCETLVKRNYFLTSDAFNTRRNFLCKPETGYLTRER
jgi:S-adenosylmethionine:diacylglycerol 3-amino-3-carboxypropyl transferase